MTQIAFAGVGVDFGAFKLLSDVSFIVAPGERWDAIAVADEPGVWAFHCHILSHAEGPTGMFGMVTALIVTP